MGKIPLQQVVQKAENLDKNVVLYKRHSTIYANGNSMGAKDYLWAIQNHSSPPQKCDMPEVLINKFKRNGKIAPESQ